MNIEICAFPHHLFSFLPEIDFWKCIENKNQKSCQSNSRFDILIKMSYFVKSNPLCIGVNVVNIFHPGTQFAISIWNWFGLRWGPNVPRYSAKLGLLTLDSFCFFPHSQFFYEDFLLLLLLHYSHRSRNQSNKRKNVQFLFLTRQSPSK